jgi:Peptidase S24-like
MDGAVAPSARLEQVAPDLVSQVLRQCGRASLRVAGTSMLPAIRPSDVLLVRAADITMVTAGDVVLFEAGQRLFAHRVIRAASRGGRPVLITRGDMHWHDDAVVSAAQLLGRVEGQLRNGAVVTPRAAPQRRSGGRFPRLRFECLCSVRRYAHAMRASSVERVVNGLSLFRWTPKPVRRPAQHPVDVRERQHQGGPARVD